jgi:hypothetical protein
MKIGILTFHWATNYGAVLQCYALQQTLAEMGHDVEVINYKPQRYDFSWRKYFRRPSSIKHIKRDYIQNKKEKLLVQFRTKYLNLTQRYYANRDLDKISSNYDVVISGSDQILNPYFTNSGEDCPTSTYYLTFASKSTKKIGYAVSFGCTTYPETVFLNAKEWISNFDKIGVREKSGFEILNSFNYKNERILVPDPTILRGKNLFSELKITTPLIKDYYCVYVLRNNIQINAEEKVFYIDETNNPLSIEGWLGYISHSKGLITNSYHGMIMAILFHIPFVVILEKKKNISGMNDRFITLLSQLDLMNRIADSGDSLVSICSNEIDWENVDKLLIKFQNIGKSFLSL